MAKSGKFSVEIGGSSQSVGKPEEAQIDRFRRVAQELGCEESEEAFKEKLARIARHRPKTPSGGIREV